MEKLDYRINILFNQGCFTRRFALFYINLMNKEFENMHFNKDQIEWAHSKGFLLESALAYGLLLEVSIPTPQSIKRFNMSVCLLSVNQL